MMILSRCHRSIDVLHADLPVISLTDIDPYCVTALGIGPPTPFRYRAYVVADCIHLKRLAMTIIPPIPFDLA